MRAIQRPLRSASAARFAPCVSTSVSNRPIWLVEAACPVTAAPPTTQRMAGSCALEVHAKPQDGDEQPGYTSSHVLGGLGALITGKLLNPPVVRLHLSDDRGTIHKAVLRLDGCDRLWGSSSARCAG